MDLAFRPATPDDASGIAGLRRAVADDLTRRYGKGHWSFAGTEKSVLHDIQTSSVVVAENTTRMIATLRLASRKPWAIDTKYFRDCGTPLYLTTMAVDPGMQRRGIGRRCIGHARQIAGEWAANAIRLDAYDAPAGAGEFYVKCGFREVGRVSYRENPLVYLELMLSEST